MTLFDKMGKKKKKLSFVPKTTLWEMLPANVIIMSISQREKERYQLIHLFKPCNFITHPASYLGLLLPLNGETPLTDDTSGQSSIPQQNNTTKERRRHETKDEEKSSLQWNLCTMLINEHRLRLGWTFWAPLSDRPHTALPPLQSARCH